MIVREWGSRSSRSGSFAAPRLAPDPAHRTCPASASRALRAGSRASRVVATRTLRRLVSWLAALPWLVSSALAANTALFEMLPRQALPAGELDQVVWSSRGHLALGPSRISTAANAKEIWDSAAAEDGSIWYVTGGPASLQRLPPPSPGADGLVPGVPQTIFTAEDIAFTAMVRHADASCDVATIPRGRILHVTASGQGRILTTLSTPLLWCLVSGPDGALYAGGGPDGVIHRIVPGATPVVELYFDTRDRHVLAMAWGPDGSLWASTSGKGGLHRIEGPGKGRLVTSFAGREVKAMAFRGDVLVLAVNQSTAGGEEAAPEEAGSTVPDVAPELPGLDDELDGEPPPRPEDQSAPETPPPPPLAVEPAGYRPPDGSSVILLHPDERQEEVMSLDTGFILDVAVDSQQRIHLALGGEGQVRQLEPEGHWLLISRNEGGMVSTLAVSRAGLVFAGSSNPGSLLQLLPDRPAAEGTYTGATLDAKVLSRWGHLEALVQGALGFETRSGNTMRPDLTWSAWTSVGPGSQGTIPSPPARWLQVRARWEADPAAKLQELSAYYLNQNQKPRIDSFDIGGATETAAATEDAKPDELDKVLEIEKKDGPSRETPSSPGAKESPAEDEPATTKVELAWSARDEDGDTLVYRLWYRTLAGSPWLPITPKEPLDVTSHTWETDSVPDGRYLLKIQATDERSNPPGKSLTAERELGPLLVDNGRPRVEALAAGEKGHILGTAADETSPVRRLEFQLDGQEWHPFHSKDGLLDSKVEAFDLELPPLAPGAHVLAVRATDAKGNTGTALLVLGH